MYPLFLSLHNILRWVVLIFALLATIRSLSGWLGRGRWTAVDDRLGMLFTISLDLQVLVGLILFVALSPITTGALADFGAAMQNAVVRFFTAEHTLAMILALALAHIGRARVRKAADDKDKFRRAAVFFTLATIVILAAIPWPFLVYGAPWLRLP